ncbi:hypothetical protein JCM1840_002270 [Sporobolomyces johnsonii]
MSNVGPVPGAVASSSANQGQEEEYYAPPLFDAKAPIPTNLAQSVEVLKGFAATPTSRTRPGSRFSAGTSPNVPTSPFLFLRQSGLVPTCTWFVGELRRLFGPAYTSHSLRSGGATYFATVKRWPPDIIKRHGRWSSDAWEAYVRVLPDIATALALAA